MSTVPIRPANDLLLVILGGASVVLSVGLAVAEALHLVPSGIAVVLVIAFASLGIRVMFRLRARASSALSKPAVMNIVSIILLGVSVVTAAADVGVALQGHDPGNFFLDLLQHGWSLLLLLVIAVPARTMGWRSILGVVLTGLLAVSSLALLVDSPVVNALGSSDQFVVAFFVPLTEELLKALPVALFALLALRNRDSRPAALDFGLLGFATGMGFALIEDAAYGRVIGSWDAVLPLSAVFPSMSVTDGFVSQGQIIAGHAIWSGFIGLGIGFGVLYSRRFRFAWIAIPVTVALAVTEHGLTNADVPPFALAVLTFHGALVAVLFPLAMIAATVFERRPLRGIADLRAGVLLTPTTLAVQRASLAARQRPRARLAGTASATPAASSTPTASTGDIS